MASDLELLTVGRISIDLYCDQVGADWNAAETFSKAVGGSATNVAIAAARLGHRTAVFTKVGEDPFGEVALAELRDFGVDTRFAGVEPRTVTPLAFAVLDPPENPQLLFRRDPPVPDFQLRPDDVDPATVTDVPILWVTAGALSHEPSASTAAGMLNARGRRGHTVLDLDYRPTFWRSREEASARIGAAVEHATIAVGNREECAVAVGSEDPREAAARLRARGVEVAIVKLGGDGRVAVERAGRAPHRAAADPGAVRARGGRCVRRRAVPRVAVRMAPRAHDRVRKRRRRDRRLAPVVLAGDAVRTRGGRVVGKRVGGA